MRLRLGIYLICVLMWGAVPAWAQQKLKFSVAEFRQDPLDLSARNEQFKRTDDNGTLYSIIKVKSDFPDDDLQSYHFDFGLMNSFVEMHDDLDELWIYVQKNAKTVTISRDGYSTVSKYDLRTTIAAGSTYLMTLSTSGPVVYTQMVMFQVEPKNVSAVIMIKNEKAGAMEEFFGVTDQTGGVAKGLPFGTYTYKVAADNYYTTEGRFTLDNQIENHVETVTLRTNAAMVTLIVESDAEIYVDGVKKGTRSWTGALKKGAHQVECRQENHRPSSKAISLVDNSTQTITLPAPTPITGTLAITSRPLGANITIDGKDYGKTPKNLPELLIGKHIVTLSKNGSKSERKQFEIQEGKTTHLEISLVDGSDAKQPAPKKEIKKSYSTVNQNNTYLYLMAGAQIGSNMAANATIGAYLSNFNIEASFLYGLGASDDIYWKKSSISYYRCNYQSMAYGGKVGYGVNLLNKRLRLTPQVGATIVSIHSQEVDYENVDIHSDNISNGYALSAAVGLRADYTLTRHFGVYLAPEIDFSVMKSDVFSQLADVSTAISSWANGFNIRIGLCLSF